MRTYPQLYSSVAIPDATSAKASKICECVFVLLRTRRLADLSQDFSGYPSLPFEKRAISDRRADGVITFGSTRSSSRNGFRRLGLFQRRPGSPLSDPRFFPERRTLERTLQNPDSRDLFRRLCSGIFVPDGNGSYRTLLY